MNLLTPAPERRTAGPPVARAALLALVATVVFAVFAVLVDRRDLAALDFAVARALHLINSPLLDRFSEAVAVAFSGELSLVYGFLLAAYLWRRGFRGRAVAPFAFLPLVVVEIVLKQTVHQPPLPPDLYRGLAYPLANVTLHGAFPSGHAIRFAFFVVFLATWWRSRGGTARWLAPLVGELLILVFGLSRLYEEVHWASDVLGGVLLGAPVGYLAAGYFVVVPREDRAGA